MSEETAMQDYAPRVTVVVVTYNSSSVIAQCLRAIPNAIGGVVVVDNASSDNTADVVKRYRPQARLIANSSNLGFGRANNIALETVATEFTLLVNPDACLDEGCISELVKAADRYPRAMILTPLTYNDRGVSKFSYSNSVFRSPGTFIVPEGDICAEFVSGAVMLLRMTYLHTTGMFDENIFMYWEDQDLCLRARSQGYSCIAVSSARAFHGLGVSSPVNWRRLVSRERVYTWSYLYLHQKYRGAAGAKRLARSLVWNNIFLPFVYAVRLKKKKFLKSVGRAAGARDFLAEGNRQQVS